MKKHRFARFVALVLLFLAVVVLLGGIFGSIAISSSGFGSGWSEGWRGWFTYPVICLSCFSSFGLLMLGAILLLLVDTANNLANVKPAVQAPPFVLEPPAGVVVAPAALEAPAVEAVPVAAVAATAAAVEATRDVEPPPVEEVVPAVPLTAEAKGMTEARAQAEAEARAAAERAEAVPVGVPVAEPDASVRFAAVEVVEVEGEAAEEGVEAEAAPEAPAAKPKRKRTRKPTPEALAAMAAVAVAAEASKEEDVEAPSAEELAALGESVEELKSGVDALETAAVEELGEPRLPGAEEAARIAAELAVIEEAAAKPKRQRKPAKFTARVVYVSGISEEAAQKLEEIGILTTEDLLTRGSTRKGRQEIADLTGLDLRDILTWVNHLDLYRIRGIGEEYAQLLEASGVDTVVELAQRNPENLQAKVSEVNDEVRLVRQVPVLTQIERWIEEAKTLPRMIHY